MKYFYSSFVILATLFFASCASTDTANSDAVKQSEIYQSYTVTYDSGASDLNATAFFRFGGSTGTTLNLSDPSHVSFDGEDMPMQNNVFTGTYYEISKQSPFTDTHEFVFTDTEKKNYLNRAVIKPVEINECPARINLHQRTSVSWVRPLEQNETIYLYIEDNKGNTASFSTTTVGVTSIEVNPEQLNTLTIGVGNVYLASEINANLADATHLGGKLFIKYISKKVKVDLVAVTP